MSLYDDLEAILLDADAIQAEVRRLGERISKDFADRHPHLIGVLKGSSVFLSDLIRTLTVPVTVDYIWISP